MKKIIFSPLFLVIWMIVIGAISYSLLQSLIGIRGSTARYQELERKNALMQKNIEQLQVKIDKAGTPFAKEKIIREELGLQLPGETVVQLNQIASSGGSAPLPVIALQTPDIQAKNQPVYRQWIELFFGR